MAEQRRTVCNRDCPDACAVVATVEDERVVRLQGDPAHPITRGFLCHRTSHFLETQYHPGRLTSPLWRERTTDAFEAISWERAFALAAARLLRIRAESGPAAIFHYRSGGSLGLLKHLCDYFFEHFGPVTKKRGDICSGAGDAAQLLDFGDEDSSDLRELLNSKNILLWGKNVVTSSPHTLPVLKDAMARGAKCVLIDPVFHQTAMLCERHVQPRPGCDFALAMAVGRRLFERGLVVSDADTFCDHVDGFRALAFERSAEAWAGEADVTLAEIEDLTTRLGADGPTAILVGWGMGRRRNGAAIVRALDALGALSGNLGVSGGGVSFYFKRRGAFDTSFIGRRPPPRTVCEPLLGAELLGLQDPPIRAVWITAGNPVAMLPESETTRRALLSREFVVVVDSWRSDTADCAHLVLPTTTLLEADDLLGAYGHHALGVATPVVAPPPGVKSDLEIFQGLAAHVGLGELMAGDARSWKRRFLSPRLREHGVTLETLEAGAVSNPLPAKVLFADRKFPTATGRVKLIERAPLAAPAGVSTDYPLQLLSLSTDRSQSSVWARPQQGLAVATVHPEVATALGLPDGAAARLESRIGSMQVQVRHDPRQRRDVVLVPKGGHLREGRCANALIRAALTDLGEGAALYDESVRLVPLGEARQPVA